MTSPQAPSSKKNKHSKSNHLKNTSSKSIDLKTADLKASDINNTNSNAILPVIASPSTRLFSVLYDFLLVTALVLVSGVILTVIGTYLFGLYGNGHVAKQLPAWYLYVVVFPILLFVAWSFYAVFWHKSGQTLGMQTWHLKVVRADGQLLSYSLGYFRCAMATLVPTVTALFSYFVTGSPTWFVVSFVMGFILNDLFALTNPRRLSIQDYLSGTVVLKMPSPKLRWFNRKKA